MQILESSRPITKCEHFLSPVLHFQVAPLTQQQARGDIATLTADVCVCRNRSVCARVHLPARVRCCVRDLTVGFPFSSVCAFCRFWRIGQTFIISF